jgi:cell wall-associated NlpC family hydrolase
MTENDQRAAVIAEAMTWMGTPYAHAACIKGRKGGVDCGNLLSVYEVTGVCGRIEWPTYSMQWGLHHSEELFVDNITKHGAPLIAETDARPGDIVAYKAGRTYSHVAILVEDWPGNVIHSMVDFGVLLSHGTKEGFLAGRKRLFFSPWVRERTLTAISA